MGKSAEELRHDAVAIWQAGVAAVRADRLIEGAWQRLPRDWHDRMAAAPRILVVGCGKAGGAMAVALESVLGPDCAKVTGLVNVPDGLSRTTRAIRLHPARPPASNHPTPAGVAGADEMLRLLSHAHPNDVAICLISGGGSALLPAPAEGLTLLDKQLVTTALHACGATIEEMNAVRKHLSRVKGGRLAASFRGCLLLSFIISDVIGDPLDVIASGPTAADPTTFSDALEVLQRYKLTNSIPSSALRYLEQGRRGEHPETLKQLPESVHNLIIGNNTTALMAAMREAQHRGYRVVNLGPYVEGESREVGISMAGVARGLSGQGSTCVLIGGETTVTLGEHPGRGGRNQEFVLACLTKLGQHGMDGVAILSGGTDGEDGPTDAAGAIATQDTLRHAERLGLNPHLFLARHDSYPFLDQTDALLRTGLTETNVMDLRVLLIQ